MQITDTEGVIDIPRMRHYRLQRVREQIRAFNYGAVVLLDPLSIRYATGVRNCALFQTHILAGYLFVPAHGPVIYFDAEPGLLTAGSWKPSMKSVLMRSHYPICWGQTDQMNGPENGQRK